MYVSMLVSSKKEPTLVIRIYVSLTDFGYWLIIQWGIIDIDARNTKKMLHILKTEFGFVTNVIVRVDANWMICIKPMSVSECLTLYLIVWNICYHAH